MSGLPWWAILIATLGLIAMTFIFALMALQSVTP